MKQTNVAFVSQRLKDLFDSLREGKFEDQQLYSFIDRAIDDLKRNPACGTKVSRHLWPKEYTPKYGITNLWKYDLPNAWRLMYTLDSDQVKIVSIILEWFDHKEYERRFGY